MDSLQLWIALILAGMATLGNIFLVYNHFRNPDIKSSARLDKMEAVCPIKHQRIDEWIQEIKNNISQMNNAIMLIKENDIKHIEVEMRRMSDVQTKILTVLEYREKDNKN